MARPLFEQYKDALRRGHVALLGGELDAALLAYREAADLVPDRALPHASMGTVLERLGRREEALAAFDRALAIVPDDEATRRARAEAVGDATSTTVPEPEGHAEGGPAPGAQAADAQAADAATAWPPVDLPSPPEPPLEGPPPDPAVLQTEADASLDAGDVASARDRLLLAMTVHRDAGRLDAALDACLQVLAIAPGDPRVHLAIANLQLDHGWREVATEKIELLLRLTSLSGDAQAEADVHLLAADRLRDESPERLDARRRGIASP